MFLFVSFSFSQKKELRTAKKLFSNAQYEEVEKVLLDSKNFESRKYIKNIDINITTNKIIDVYRHTLNIN